MRNPAALIAVILAVLLSSLVAKAAELEKIVVADTSEKFEVLVQAIKQEMSPGGRFETIKGRSRREVNDLLEEMSAMMQKSGSVSAMSQDDKLALQNAQEKVNGLLARNANDRLICTNVAPVGSHLPVKQCHTVRELETSRRNAKSQMDALNKAGRAN